jgi:hypothetical protein
MTDGECVNAFDGPNEGVNLKEESGTLRGGRLTSVLLLDGRFVSVFCFEEVSSAD